MSFGKFIDKMMGDEIKTCDPNDSRVLGLLQAGISSFSKKVLTSETRLNELGDAKLVHNALGNVNSLFVKGTLGEFIIQNETIGEMISQLDQSKVDIVFAQLLKEEKRQQSSLIHDDLDDLNKEILS